jgi:hypothetical protein
LSNRSTVCIGSRVSARESTAFGLLARKCGVSKCELMAILIRAAISRPDFDECFKCAKGVMEQRLIRYSIGR